MTFVFFVGVLVVFLPVGLGFGGVGEFFIRSHDWIYNLGAIFLLLLAFSIFFGFHPRIPLHANPKSATQNIPAIFLLGIFSGLATVCCAPVLAGVLALSVLPGSIFWGGIYSLAYVLGMVLPLFVIAMFLDTVNFTEKFLLFNRMFRLKSGREISLANLFSSLMFLVMGGLILFLSFNGKLTMDSSFQKAVNIFIIKYVQSTSALIKNIPEFVLPLLFILILLIIIRLATRHKGEIIL